MRDFRNITHKFYENVMCVYLQMLHLVTQASELGGLAWGGANPHLPTFFLAKLDLTIRHIASGRTNPQLFLAANIIFLDLQIKN